MTIQYLNKINLNNSNKSSLPQKPKNVFPLWKNNFRFIILLIGFLLCTSLSININLFNFTLICINSNNSEEKEIIKKENNQSNNNILNKNELNYLMLAIGLGNLISIFPFIFLYSKFGPRLVLFYSSLISAIFTGLTPLAKLYGFWTFLLVRIIQGITYSADFSALGILCVQWAPLEENGLFLSLASSFSPASVFIANFLSGIICSLTFLSWHFIYYISSIFCFILSFIWLLFYKELPQLSNQVTSKELKIIQKGKNNYQKINKQKIPFKEILMSRLIWVCFLNSFAELIPAIFIIQYKPQYFNYILKYNIFDTGWLTALPSLLHIPLKLIVGWASDKISFISERKKLILFNNLSVGLPGISYIAIVFAPNSTFAFFGFISASIFYSAACGGFYKCAILNSRQFGHLIMTGIQLNKCLAFFISPILMNIFVNKIENKSEWNNIFILFSILSFLANILFCIFATDKPEKFTQNEEIK